MRVGLAFVAGMIGWAVMVGLTILLRAVGATELNLSMIVGSLFTGQVSGGTWVLGFVAGLIISGLIALIYAAAFEGLRRSNWRLGLIGGAIHAAIGGLFFGLMSSFHPAMPNLITPPGPYAVNYGAGDRRRLYRPAPDLRRDRGSDVQNGAHPDAAGAIGQDAGRARRRGRRTAARPDDSVARARARLPGLCTQVGTEGRIGRPGAKSDCRRRTGPCLDLR